MSEVTRRVRAEYINMVEGQRAGLREKISLLKEEINSLDDKIDELWSLVPKESEEDQAWRKEREPKDPWEGETFREIILSGFTRKNSLLNIFESHYDSLFAVENAKIGTSLKIKFSDPNKAP